MPAGAATAADVPGKYDVVIDGYGYCYLDSLEESIPFRTHRAAYGQTQPFVERQNVSNSYGDNAQDFFLTVRQRSWSLGEQQKYFRSGTDGFFWHGSNVDVSIAGQVTLTKQTSSLTFAAAAITGCVDDVGGDRTGIYVATATKLYNVDVAGTITDLGAHGLGAAPSRYGVCTDGGNAYLTTTHAGTVGVRRYTGGLAGTFSTFSASGADSLVFLNNTLYGWRESSGDLVSWDTAGTLTSIFPWKSAVGATSSGATGVLNPLLAAYGGQVLICFPWAYSAAELWIHDGVSPKRIEVFPNNFIPMDIEVLYGVAYVSGNFYKSTSTTTLVARPAILYFDGSSIGLLWQADAYGTTSIASSAYFDGPGPALGTSDGRLLFTDDTMNSLMAYNPALGGVSSIGSYSAGGTIPQIISSGSISVMTRTQTAGYYFPHATATNTSGYVQSSQIDFDSSLQKVLRGATVEFDAASDGDGGSVDIAYQLNGVGGSYTSLATGVTSGTEVTFPANTTGHSISLKVTLNKGTSTNGPTLKSYSVRGAPVMPIYPRGEYIIDCTGTPTAPRELRDGSLHAVTGYDQVKNLIAARNATTPISITDKINGTYSGFVDVSDPEGFDAYEVHAAGDSSHPGSFVVRLSVRGV
jgi:hypothetical protein